MTIAFSPLTTQLVEHLGTVLRGNMGRGLLVHVPAPDCPGQARVARIRIGQPAVRREAMAQLETRSPSPRLLAFEDGEPVGWIAVAPRRESARNDGSRATPRVYDADVWVIPCVTVRKGWRGRGVAIALIQAAVQYAPRRMAHPLWRHTRGLGQSGRATTTPISERKPFARAGFQVVRGPLKDRPRNWLPNLAMRIKA